MKFKVSVKNNSKAPFPVQQTVILPGKQAQMELDFPNQSFLDKITQFMATKGIVVTPVS